MTIKRRLWTRDELIIAFNLYCKIEFGKIHSRNKLIIEIAQAINRTPSAVAWKLVNFASLDPVHMNRGVKGASNSGKLDKVIFNEFSNNWDDLIYESELLLSKLLNKSQLTDTIELKEGKEVERNVKVRVNQYFFRRTVLSSYDFKCCVTGIDIPELLIASHIVPWSEDERNRLNPQNGLCLNSIHDKAFDRGLISFDEDYKIMLSEEIKQNKNESIHANFHVLEGKRIMLPNKFLPNIDFLKYHNDNIFNRK